MHSKHLIPVYMNKFDYLLLFLCQKNGIWNLKEHDIIIEEKEHLQPIIQTVDTNVLYNTIKRNGRQTSLLHCQQC